jgi:hypothetical protein
MKSPRRKRAKPRRGKPRAKRHQATVAAKPSTTAAKPQRAAVPSKKRKAGLSPECLETIGKILPGIIDAVAKLIEALKAH